MSAAAVFCFAAGQAFGADVSRPTTLLTDPVTETHFGTTLIDPYRWMEARPKPAFDTFLKGHDARARSVLASLPGRAELGREIGAIGALTTEIGSVTLAGGKIAYLKRAQGADASKLYIRSLDSGAETMLVDPATLRRGGEPAEIVQLAVSPDASLLAFVTSDGVLRVIRTGSRTLLRDRIDRAQFAAVAWAPDGASFFYSRLPKPASKRLPAEAYSHLRILLHRIGSDPECDAVILDTDHLPFPFEAAQVFPAVSVAPGSDYAVATMSDGVSPEQAYYVAPLAVLAHPPVAWQNVAEMSDGVTSATVQGTRIFLLTHNNAPRLRVVAEELASPGFQAATEIVAQPESGVLTSLAAAADALYVARRVGSAMRLARVPYGSGVGVAVALPFEGTIAPPEEDAGDLVADPREPGALLGLQSWLHAPVWLRFHPASAALADMGLMPPFPRDLSGYEVTETAATSFDGTPIPLTVVAKRHTKLDGSHPTLIEGYGSYGVSLDATFTPTLVPWLDRGGVFAVAHVRGGGELGQAWRDGGKVASKENTIRDYIACAEELIRRGYTTSGRLGGEGDSAGGIAAAGAITRRPGLFRAVVIAAGSVNPIRGEFTANGPANIPEFGSVTNAAQFPSLLAMDAYQHVSQGTPYPAVLLTGGYNDSLVEVWEPAKMAARLETATSSGRPILLRIDFAGGHDPGPTRRQRDDEDTDRFAFLLWQLGQR